MANVIPVSVNLWNLARHPSYGAALVSSDCHPCINLVTPVSSQLLSPCKMNKVLFVSRFLKSKMAFSDRLLTESASEDGQVFFKCELLNKIFGCWRGGERATRRRREGSGGFWFSANTTFLYCSTDWLLISCCMMGQRAALHFLVSLPDSPRPHRAVCC